MARGKKKEELSLEEKLEQALVPVEEQPYEVPENWCWVTIESISDIVSKGTTPKGGKSSYIEDGIRFLRVENFLDDGTISHEGIMHITEDIHFGFLKRSILKKDDVLISIAGTLGKTVIVQEDNLPINTNQAVAFIRLNSKAKILPKYLRFSLINPVIQNYLLEKTKVTSIPNLTLEIISTCPIPLPPKEEQQRIVERIESLFAKLDEAKEKVSDVVQSSEIRQLALINRLFTGELAGIKEAYTIPLFDIVEEIKIGPFGSSLHKEDYIMGGTPVINPKHISKQGINPDQEVSITSEKARELSSYALKENDIIMGRRGEMGRTAPVSQKEEGYICGTGSLIIRLKKEFRADLYSQILGSQCVINYLEQNCVGSTMKNLNEKIVKQIPIPYFSKEQQEKLMFRFETMLAEEQQVLDKLGGIVDAISLIKKAILAKAFRGELGTNNPDEESAIELLKAVLMEP